MTGTESNAARRRLPIALVAIAAALLLSGCPGTTDPMSCNCPKLVETVQPIDWIGDGTTPSSIDPYPGPSERLSHHVILNYEVADAAAIAALQQQVEDRLKSFPTVFQTGADRQGSVEFVSDDWIVYIGGVIHEGTTSMTVFVYIDDDDHAAEILAPIAEVLGTIDPGAG
ncbi:MAG: hypothetical protein GY788_20670 [bacterium]|nr:hypothetical protein [bacterium]